MGQTLLQCQEVLAQGGALCRVAQEVSESEVKLTADRQRLYGAVEEARLASEAGKR